MISNSGPFLTANRHCSLFRFDFFFSSGTPPKTRAAAFKATEDLQSKHAEWSKRREALKRADVPQKEKDAFAREKDKLEEARGAAVPLCSTYAKEVERANTAHRHVSSCAVFHCF